MSHLTQLDPEVADAIRRQPRKQNETIEMIAPENFVGGEVRREAKSLCDRFPLYARRLQEDW